MRLRNRGFRLLRIVAAPSPHRSTNPGSMPGLRAAFPAIHPVMYIHYVILVSFA